MISSFKRLRRGLAWTGLDWPGPTWTAWTAWTGLDGRDQPGPAWTAWTASTAWAGLHRLGGAPGHRFLRRGRSRLFQSITDLGPQARLQVA